MKSIASFLPIRDQKPNPASVPIVTPRQSLILSAVFLAMSAWPLLTVLFGRPTSWLGNALVAACGSFSVVGAPTLCLLALIDIVRRKKDARLIAAFVLSLTGVAAMTGFIYLCVYSSAP